MLVDPSIPPTLCHLITVPQITGTHYRCLLHPLLLFTKNVYEDLNAKCTVYSYPPIAQNIHKFTQQPNAFFSFSQAGPFPIYPFPPWLNLPWSNVPGKYVTTGRHLWRRRH